MNGQKDAFAFFIVGKGWNNLNRNLKWFIRRLSSKESFQTNFLFMMKLISSAWVHPNLNLCQAVELQEQLHYLVCSHFFTSTNRFTNEVCYICAQRPILYFSMSLYYSTYKILYKKYDIKGHSVLKKIIKNQEFGVMLFNVKWRYCLYPKSILL